MLKNYGGNAIRTESKQEKLDQAQSSGFIALPVRAERDRREVAANGLLAKRRTEAVHTICYDLQKKLIANPPDKVPFGQ